jgi:hypothetical protein
MRCEATRLLHAVFLPEVPGPGLATWVADAERQVQANGGQDEAKLLGRVVYLHTRRGTRAANCAAGLPGQAGRPQPQ